MFNSIVVGTDGSDTAAQAVREAVDLAKADSATLELVSAFAPVSERRLRTERRDAPEEVRQAISPRQEAEEFLGDAADVAREAGVKVNTHARQGDPADAILDVAEETDAGLVIVGNKGHDGRLAFPARLGAGQDLASCALLGPHRQNNLSAASRRAKSAPSRLRDTGRAMSEESTTPDLVDRLRSFLSIAD